MTSDRMRESTKYVIVQHRGWRMGAWSKKNGAPDEDVDVFGFFDSEESAQKWIPAHEEEYDIESDATIAAVSIVEGGDYIG